MSDHRPQKQAIKLGSLDGVEFLNHRISLLGCLGGSAQSESQDHGDEGECCFHVKVEVKDVQSFNGTFFYTTLRKHGRHERIFPYRQFARNDPHIESRLPHKPDRFLYAAGSQP